jgi:HNH endonuclease
MYRWLQGQWRYEAVAPIEGLLVEPSREAKDAVRFYWGNYTCIGQRILEPGKKIVLRSSRPGVCRFCGLAEPEVTFRDKVHAIPESTGNKSLTTKYECDRCNRLFGSGIENDFGNWSKAQRAMSGVRGKGPPPTLKEESRRQWRFEHGADGIKVTQDEKDPIAVVNEDSAYRSSRPLYPCGRSEGFRKNGVVVTTRGGVTQFSLGPGVDSQRGSQHPLSENICASVALHLCSGKPAPRKCLGDIAPSEER